MAIVGMAQVHLVYCWPAKLLAVHATLLEVTREGIIYEDIPVENAPPPLKTPKQPGQGPRRASPRHTE